MSEFPRHFVAAVDDAGKRLDQFLVRRLPDASRSRIQQMIEQEKVLVDEKPARAS